MRVYLSLVVLMPIMLGALISCVWGQNNYAKWALHYAGPHDAKGNTCDFTMTDCASELDVDAPQGPGDFDVYVIGVHVLEINATRLGIYGEGRFYFAGWSNCADLEIATQGWPGCGQGTALSWNEVQMGPNVNLGILEIYAYGGGRLWTGVDPRVGFAEWCNGAEPDPNCARLGDDPSYCILGFGELGCLPCPLDGQGCYAPGFDLEQYGNCGLVPAGGNTWGAVKALYR